MKRFSAKNIRLKESLVFQRHHLQPLELLSASGHYLVRRCRNSRGQKFILKIRLQKGARAKRVFVKEIKIWQALRRLADRQKIIVPEKIIYSLTGRLEYLIYSLIPGHNLGNYYHIDWLTVKNLSSLYLAEQLTKTDRLIKAHSRQITNLLVKPNKLIDRYDCRFHYQVFCRLARRVKLPEPLTKALAQRIIKESSILDQNLVFSHNDLNPINIIVTPQKKIAFIDWSSAAFNNQLFDLTFLWYFTYTRHQLQQELESKILQIIPVAKPLFDINRIIILPKFIQVLNDSKQFTLKEFHKGLLKQEIKDIILKRLTKGYNFAQQIINSLKL